MGDYNESGAHHGCKTYQRLLGARLGCTIVGGRENLRYIEWGSRHQD